MEIRKLVKSGYSSLVVALPRQWIETNQLKAGDQVFIDEDNNILFINHTLKEKTVERTEKVVNIDNKSRRVIMREIISAYLDDYYYLVLKGKELRKKSGDIKDMISELIALEVIDESSEKIVAKSFLNIYDADLKLLVRRIDNIIRSMIIDTKELLNNPEIMQNIIDRDTEINKLNFLISKVLKTANKDRNVLYRLGLGDEDLLKYWEINGALEKIGDRIKHIARCVPEISEGKRFIVIFNKVEKFYIESMKAFYNSSISLSDEICDMKAELGKDIGEFSSGKSIALSKIAINMFNINGHINDIGRVVRYLS